MSNERLRVFLVSMKRAESNKSLELSFYYQESKVLKPISRKVERGSCKQKTNKKRVSEQIHKKQNKASVNED